jgi:hypothetical protein
MHKFCFSLLSGWSKQTSSFFFRLVWGGGMVMLQVHKMLKTVYLNEILSHVCVFEWFKRFREECDSFEDESSHGHLLTAKIWKQLQKAVNWWPESVK